MADAADDRLRLLIERIERLKKKEGHRRRYQGCLQRSQVGNYDARSCARSSACGR
jgi:uncharacterized protein (UPF0335 family)